MCCEKCTAGGISTTFGEKLYNTIPEDDRWKLHCPKMSGSDYAENRVMWGICRATDELARVECCKKCDYFS